MNSNLNSFEKTFVTNITKKNLAGEIVQRKERHKKMKEECLPILLDQINNKKDGVLDLSLQAFLSLSEIFFPRDLK